MKYPIVLAHGIAPFDELYQPFLKVWKYLGRNSDRFDYFKGIASHLTRYHFKVTATHVDFAGSVEKRAGELALEVGEVLAGTGASKIHIIAHSMGGLDARHMIVDNNMHDKVATLTTIGTPHNGTPFADAGIEKAGFLVDLLGNVGSDISGFEDLQTGRTAEFNQRAEKIEAENPVHYVVYASHQGKDRVFGALKPSWEIINAKEGENDGLVSVKSQSWTSALTGEEGQKTIRQETFPIEADHLNELGWWDLDQLRGTSWWKFGFRKDIRAFERQVKDAYLKMARHAESLVA